MFTVKVSQKNGPEQVLKFSDGEVRIGRVSSNEIVLPKSNISKRHALLTHSSGGLAITDTKSTNGTFVNGERINGVCDLTLGDKVYLGEFTVEVVEIKIATNNEPELSRIETKSQPKLDPVIGSDKEAVLSDDWGANGEISDSWTGDWKSQTAQAQRDSAAVDALDMASGFPTIEPSIEAHDFAPEVIIPPAPATATTPMVSPAPYIDGASTASVVENPHVQHADLDLDGPELSFGPISDLIADPKVKRIDINQPGHVFADSGQGAQETKVSLNTHEIESFLDSLLKQVGRSLQATGPLIDFSLPDGTHILATRAPVSLHGPNITIHKRQEHPSKLDAMLPTALCDHAATFLKQCLLAQRSIVVAGASYSSDPVYTLGALASSIQDTVRIVTVGRSAELKLKQTQVVSLTTADENATTGELLKHAIAMKPGYLIACDSISAKENLAWLSTTGHLTYLASIYAPTPEDASKQLGQSNVDLLICQNSNGDGQPIVTGIYEIKDNKPVAIFTRSDNGNLEATGTIPTLCQEPHPRGVEVDASIFKPA